MKQRRIPIIYAAFDAYINRTSTYLWEDDPANAGHKQYERLGLSLAEATEWKNRCTAWNALYALYTDEASKTLPLIRQCVTFKKSFILYGHPIINRIASNPAATEVDASKFNFKLTRKKPSRPTTKIEETVIAGINRIGSGNAGVQCRYDKDAKRPSLLPQADGVQYSYKIVTTQPADPATVDPEGEGFRQVYISKAKFVAEFGSDNKGKFLLIAFRWVHSKYPALAGPWTEIQVMVLI